MTEFTNVSIIKKANIYFNGNVSSRTVKFSDGSSKTLGLMLPGEYTFSTADRELMEIYVGDLQILLPDNDEWQTIKGGESFYVPANCQFTVKVNSTTDYCCSYLK